MFSLFEVEDFLDLCSGSTLCMGTVVDKKGSSYSVPGRRMLIDSEGRTLGALSGGCIESEIIERSISIAKGGSPEILVFNTDEDSPLSYNLGCRGQIDVLLQPIDLKSHSVVAFLEGLLTRDTIPRSYLVSLDEEQLGHSVQLRGQDDLIQLGSMSMDSRLWQILKNPPASPRCIEYDGRRFLAGLTPTQRIIHIFGATPCTGILVKLARSCGFDCLVYDHRSHFIENFEREFDETVWHRHPETWQISESDHDGIWVIMSHNFEIDRCLLEKIPMARAKYVGILGSKDRFAELKDSFCKKSPAIDWTVVRAPIGLPLGGREPADIALATLAEIQAVLHKTSPEVG